MTFGSPRDCLAKENIYTWFAADEDNEQEILIMLRTNHAVIKQTQIFKLFATKIKHLSGPRISSLRSGNFMAIF
jgi:hypothetical protein